MLLQIVVLVQHFSRFNTNQGEVVRPIDINLLPNLVYLLVVVAAIAVIGTTVATRVLRLHIATLVSLATCTEHCTSHTRPGHLTPGECGEIMMFDLQREHRGLDTGNARQSHIV
jgi:hypothetical protein